MIRRLLLIIGSVLFPPLLAAVLYTATQYGLAATHRFLDSKTMNEIFLGELVLFYIAAAMELRSRWSPNVE